MRLIFPVCFTLMLIASQGVAQYDGYEVIRKVYWRMGGSLIISSNLDHDSLALGVAYFGGAGCDARFQVKDHFSLKAGLQFNQVGGLQKTPFVKIQNRHIRLSLLPTFQLGAEKKAFFSVGPAYNYLVSANSKRIDGSQQSGFRYEPINDYQSQLELLFDVSLPLTNRLDMVARSAWPLSPVSAYVYTEIGFHFKLNH